MPQDRWLLPEGIEEVLPEEARRLERLRRELLDLFATWGYELVIPPLIEYLDSLLTGAGHDLDLQTFKLIDQLSGRLLGVRADMTPQVARIDAHHLKREWPTRLCYLGTVLRTRGDPLEKTRSPMQIGAELYGHAGIDSDLEVIRLMLETLAQAGIQRVHLDLGHVGIYRGLAQQAGLEKQAESELFDILQRKSRPELIEFLEESGLDREVRRMFVNLLDMNGHADMIAWAKDELAAADADVKQALGELESVAEDLKKRFPSLPINFDLAELRGYRYHAGVVFAAFVPGCGREIARGGRYDSIGEIFGRTRPATGFSSDLKLLAALCEGFDDTNNVQAIFAPCVENPELDEKVRDLRAGGHIVIRELPGQPGGAVEMGCGYILEKQEREWVVSSMKVNGVD